jgi:hypothetical protein
VTEARAGCGKIESAGEQNFPRSNGRPGSLSSFIGRIPSTLCQAATVEELFLFLKLICFFQPSNLPYKVSTVNVFKGGY